MINSVSLICCIRTIRLLDATPGACMVRLVYKIAINNFLSFRSILGAIRLLKKIIVRNSFAFVTEINKTDSNYVVAVLDFERLFTNMILEETNENGGNDLVFDNTIFENLSKEDVFDLLTTVFIRWSSNKMPFRPSPR